jgi:hypothetical protein
MTWFASSANQTESEAEHAIMFLAVAFDFPSGFVRAWSGTGDLSFGGNTYVGTGLMGKVTHAPERAGLDAPRKTYQLSGVDPSVVPEAEIEASYGRSVTEYFGFLNKTTYALVDTPEINWEGRIDNIRRVDGYEPLIEVNAEHRMVLLDLPDGWRFTHQHQQQFYAGDNGFNQVGAIQLKEILWGSQRAIVGYTGGQHPRNRQPVYG